MKQFLTGMLAILLLCTFTVSALADAKEDAYTTIVQYYEQMESAEDDEEAIAALNNIVWYYKKKETLLADYKNAVQYYHYAAGRIAYEQGQNDEAYNHFKKIPEEFGNGTGFYLRFSEAMLKIELKDYGPAIELLKEAQVLTDSPAECIRLIDECKELYKAKLVEDGDSCCKNGQHEQAREIFQLMMEYDDISFQIVGKQKYDACLTHGGLSEEEKQQQEDYSNAQKAFNEGKYDEAAALFNKLTGADAYPDSQQWFDFCQVILIIREADQSESKGYISQAKEKIQEAQQKLNALTQSGFEPATPILAYCDARQKELRNMRQAAEDAYNELLGVMDSTERLNRLRNGVSLPTQAPDTSLPDTMKPIPAKTKRKTKLYFSPDRNSIYKGFTINEGSQFGICAKYEKGNDKWWLLEIETNQGPIRLWTVNNGLIIRKTDSEPPEIMKSGSVKFLTQSTTLMLGPGDQYHYLQGFTLTKNTKVTAYEQEGIYTLICVTDSSKNNYCGWVPTRILK